MQRPALAGYFAGVGGIVGARASLYAETEFSRQVSFNAHVQGSRSLRALARIAAASSKLGASGATACTSA